MLLLRIAGLTLRPAPVKRMGVEMQVGVVRVTVEPGPERDGGRWHLAVARVTLERRPELSDEQTVVLPDDERAVAKSALEITANVFALASGSRRTLSSPHPYLALEAENDEERRWLSASRGVYGGLGGVAQQSVVPLLPLEDAEVTNALDDRWDGLALLTEAQSQEHATGKLHEYLRLFERAFRLPAPGLGNPLVAMLHPRFGYSVDEVQHWLSDLRHPATHADRRATFVLESDVRPFLARIEQAAWDVLLNKVTWRDSSTDRRSVWGAARRHGFARRRACRRAAH
ncbi:MAG: hypothetical protein M3N47_02475 [Chloroflexota bacterium]|nr:hypothetical protein [Chloroflexota bacterium]